MPPRIAATELEEERRPLLRWRVEGGVEERRDLVPIKGQHVSARDRGVQWLRQASDDTNYLARGGDVGAHRTFSLCS